MLVRGDGAEALVSNQWRENVFFELRDGAGAKPASEPKALHTVNNLPIYEVKKDYMRYL